MKAERLAAIRRLVRDQEITGHRELLAELKNLGYLVTQATISRDLAELGLVKVRKGKEKVYSLPEVDEVRRLFKMLVIKIDVASNLGVVKTTAGAAQGIAAGLDRLGWSDLLGTVAGDDTVLLVLRDDESAQRIGRRLRKLKEG